MTAIEPTSELPYLAWAVITVLYICCYATIEWVRRNIPKMSKSYLWIINTLPMVADPQVRNIVGNADHDHVLNTLINARASLLYVIVPMMTLALLSIVAPTLYLTFGMISDDPSTINWQVAPSLTLITLAIYLWLGSYDLSPPSRLKLYGMVYSKAAATYNLKQVTAEIEHITSAGEPIDSQRLQELIKEGDHHTESITMLNDYIKEVQQDMRDEKQ